MSNEHMNFFKVYYKVSDDQGHRESTSYLCGRHAERLTNHEDIAVIDAKALNPAKELLQSDTVEPCDYCKVQ